jgi:hypothetical protein
LLAKVSANAENQYGCKKGSPDSPPETPWAHDERASGLTEENVYSQPVIGDDEGRVSAMRRASSPVAVICVLALIQRIPPSPLRSEGYDLDHPLSMRERRFSIIRRHPL